MGTQDRNDRPRCVTQRGDPGLVSGTEGLGREEIRGVGVEEVGNENSKGRDMFGEIILYKVK